MAATKSKPVGGKPDKLWRDAIKRALHQDGEQGAKRLKALAETLLNLAAQGDLGALKEMGDRLDGKPTQQVDVAGVEDAPLITRIERVIVDAAKAE